MYLNRKIVVVMPAYNAEKTLRMTYDEVMAQGVVDSVILVDDCSRDNTAELAESLPNVVVCRHSKNTGYGGNQKSCYRLALEAGADIVIMVHPDYQYTPKLIPAMVSMIGNGLYPCVLGSRILGGQALKGGMPIWKYISNRVLTLGMNILFGAKLSEYHTGYRAFSRELLERLPLEKNMDDFGFDAQMLAQILWVLSEESGRSNEKQEPQKDTNGGYAEHRREVGEGGSGGVGEFSENQQLTTENFSSFAVPVIAEVSCPTVYFDDASSINFLRSVKYGFNCLFAALHFRFAKMGLASCVRYRKR